MSKSLFRRNAYPVCEYCVYGHPSNSGEMILCSRKGIVRPDYRCRRYRYDPLKRVPKRPPALPEFDMDDFKI